MIKMNKTYRAALLLLALLLSACSTNAPEPAGGPTAPPTGDADIAAESGESGESADVTPVTVALDWTPNTNHTGLYVAQAQGYYADEGLEVELLQAQEGGTVEQLVGAGRFDMGISYQEWVTQARLEDVPVVSVAAVIQHNTSGFASRAEENIMRPADFAGKTYGSYGSPVEQAMISALMQCDNADPESVEFVDIGSSDFFVATERGDIDFAWIFAGWTGIEAEVRGIDLNFVMINDLDCVPDYYTPVIITSEKMIAERPEVVRAFLAATSRGYEFAMAEPEAAAELLLAAVPELDADLVRQSQVYLAEQYQADAPRWGEQRLDVWQAYAAWMAERGLIAEVIDAEQAFSNDFLPPPTE